MDFPVHVSLTYLQFFINNAIWTKTLSNTTLAFRQVKKVINYINTVSYVHSKKNKNYCGNVTHVERKRLTGLKMTIVVSVHIEFTLGMSCKSD